MVRASLCHTGGNDKGESRFRGRASPVSIESKPESLVFILPSLLPLPTVMWSLGGWRLTAHALARTVSPVLCPVGVMPRDGHSYP